MPPGLPEGKNEHAKIIHFVFLLPENYLGPEKWSKGSHYKGILVAKGASSTPRPPWTGQLHTSWESLLFLLYLHYLFICL